MKKLMMIAVIIALFAASSADAGIFRRNNGAGILPYWSPGAFRGLWSQNRGPRMHYRGDFVPVNVRSY